MPYGVGDRTGDDWTQEVWACGCGIWTEGPTGALVEHCGDPLDRLHDELMEHTDFSDILYEVAEAAQVYMAKGRGKRRLEQALAAKERYHERMRELDPAYV